MDEFLLQNSADKRSLFGLAAGANDDDDNVDVSEDGSDSDFDEDEDPDKIEVPGKCACVNASGSDHVFWCTHHIHMRVFLYYNIQ